MNFSLDWTFCLLDVKRMLKAMFRGCYCLSNTALTQKAQISDAVAEMTDQKEKLRQEGVLQN